MKLKCAQQFVLIEELIDAKGKVQSTMENSIERNEMKKKKRKKRREKPDDNLSATWQDMLTLDSVYSGRNFSVNYGLESRGRK